LRIVFHGKNDEDISKARGEHVPRQLDISFSIPEDEDTPVEMQETEKDKLFKAFQGERSRCVERCIIWRYGQGMAAL